MRLPKLSGSRTSAESGAADTGGGTATAAAPEKSPEKAPEKVPEPAPTPEPASEPASEQKQEPQQERQQTATQGPKQEKAVTTQEKSTKQRRSGRDAGRAVVAGANAVRSRIASLVWLVAVVCALFLAVGALLVALDMNRSNEIVHFILSVAHKLDFGTFKDFTGKGAATKSALTNWGIAAVIYLVVGKVLDKIIRP